MQQAINLYEAVGLEDTVAYYNTTGSVDGQWYVFMIDEDGTRSPMPIQPWWDSWPPDTWAPTITPTGAA